MAEIVLTPSESKRLIAEAVAQMDIVKKALRKGKIVIARGTTNAFVAEKLTGKSMAKDAFTAGYVAPGGLEINPKYAITNEVVVIDGLVKEDLGIADVAKGLGPGDVVIKGANAIGPDGVPGVFCGRVTGTTGGTIGHLQMAALTRPFNVIIPVGLEKSISISVLKIVKELDFKAVEHAMGALSVSLVPVFGTVVTEVEAIKSLSGAEATLIGAGGIGGAEGCVVLLIQGNEARVKKAIGIIDEVKGEPPVTEPT